MADRFDVVFVCAGNICRSPMAEAFFRRAMAEGRTAPRRVSSAGLIAEHDDRAIAETLHAARKAGVDLTSHRARRFDAAQIPDRALVLVMEPGQRDAVIAAGVPAARVWLLGDLAPGAATIADPEYGTEAVFDHCASRIRDCVEGLVRCLGAGPKHAPAPRPVRAQGDHRLATAAL